jgi:hypothetical protein
VFEIPWSNANLNIFGHRHCSSGQLPTNPRVPANGPFPEKQKPEIWRLGGSGPKGHLAFFWGRSRSVAFSVGWGGARGPGVLALRLCPVARRPIGPWHALCFIFESPGCSKRTMQGRESTDTRSYGELRRRYPRRDECSNWGGCLKPEGQAPEGIWLLGRRQCRNASEETRGRPPAVGFRSCGGAPFACRTRGPRGAAANPWWWCDWSA